MYLIKKIIQKCENSANDWREGASGGRTIKIQQSDYDQCGKTELINEVKELEAAGLITDVKWIIRGSDAERIAFRLESLPEFYQMLEKMCGEKICTKQDRVNAGIQKITVEIEKGFAKPWIRDYYTYLLSRLERGDFPREMEKLDLYLKCFRGIDVLEEPTYKRIFSKRFLNHSKQFEKEAQAHILSTARKYCDEIEEGMDDKTVLAQLLIEEYAQELAVKGPLKLVIGGEEKEEELDLSKFRYGTVLNSATLKHSRILPEQAPIRRVMTIENKANFVSMPYEEDTLYFFSHGYFSPKERDFLQALRDILGTEEVAYYHTGDLDYGGIRIYQYMKNRIFPELKPYMMDVKTFNQYQEYAEPLTKESLKKLEKLEAGELSGLARRILDTGKGIEQESFLI